MTSQQDLPATKTNSTELEFIGETENHWWQPATIDQAMRMSDALAKSSLVPKAYQGRPGDVLVAMQFGSQLGISTLSALQNIAVINGRPSLWGDAALAICRAHPEFEDIDEHMEGSGEDTTAVCSVTRKGQTPVTRTFSVKDAKRASLLGKQGPWRQYPARMLQMRARGFALRDAFADALCGMAIAEEIRDIEVTVRDSNSDDKPAKSRTDEVLGRIKRNREEVVLDFGEEEPNPHTDEVEPRENGDDGFDPERDADLVGE